MHRRRAEEVLARQAAVAELRERIDFRETLNVLAAEAHVSRTGVLTSWAAATPVGFGGTDARLFAVCAGVTALLVACMAAGWVSSVAVALWLIVPGGVALAYRRRVWQVIRRVDAAADDLSLLEALLSRLEQEAFTTAKLTALHGRLEAAAVVRPSAHIAQLRRYIAARDALRNEFVRPFGLLLLVRSQAAVAIDRWHAAHRASLAAWVTAVGEFEALSSLATYAFEHPRDPFPSIEPVGPVFEATALAHPLIAEGTAVANNVALGGDGAAGARHQRLEHVRQEHPDARGRGQHGPGACRCAGPCRTAAALADWPSARPSASRTRCRRATRASTPRSCAFATS